MPNVYRLFLNITVQQVRHHFNHEIFDENNAYIPQFTTKSDTPTKREKCWILGAAFMIVSSFVTAYRIYKSYTFRKNVQRTLSNILSNQRHYQQNILFNISIYFHWLILLQVISKMFVQILQT